MYRVNKFAAFLMVLLLGVPAVACVVPSLEKTIEKQECCRAMADHCGDAGMDSDHSCCARILHEDGQFLQTRQRKAIALDFSVLAAVSETAAVPAAQLPPPELPVTPPESPPHRIAILRI